MVSTAAAAGGSKIAEKARPTASDAPPKTPPFRNERFAARIKAGIAAATAKAAITAINQVNSL